MAIEDTVLVGASQCALSRENGIGAAVRAGSLEIGKEAGLFTCGMALSPIQWQAALSDLPRSNTSTTDSLYVHMFDVRLWHQSVGAER